MLKHYMLRRNFIYLKVQCVSYQIHCGDDENCVSVQMYYIIYTTDCITVEMWMFVFIYILSRNEDTAIWRKSGECPSLEHEGITSKRGRWTALLRCQKDSCLLTRVQLLALGSNSVTLVICFRKSDSCMPGWEPRLLNCARGFARITWRFTAKPERRDI